MYENDYFITYELLINLTTFYKRKIKAALIFVVKINK